MGHPSFVKLAAKSGLLTFIDRKLLGPLLWPCSFTPYRVHAEIAR